MCAARIIAFAMNACGIISMHRLIRGKLKCLLAWKLVVNMSLKKSSSPKFWIKQRWTKLKNLEYSKARTGTLSSDTATSPSATISY